MKTFPSKPDVARRLVDLKDKLAEGSSTRL